MTEPTASIADTLDVVSEQQSKFHVVDTATPFIDKETAFTHIERTDIHPKQAGYEAMAKSFAEAIWGEYKQPKVTDPLAIIFNGKEFQSTYKPILIDNRTYVALTDYVYALEGELSLEMGQHSLQR